MLKIGDKLIKKIYLGTKEVKEIYLGTHKIYPNIGGVDTGFDGDWAYNDTDYSRSRGGYYERDVYADGTFSDKRRPTHADEVQQALSTSSATEWTGYNDSTHNRQGTLTVTATYQGGDTHAFNSPTSEAPTSEAHSYNWTYNGKTREGRDDIVATYSDGSTHTFIGANITEEATESNVTYGAITYNDPVRTRVKTTHYAFSDGTPSTYTDTETLTQTATVTDDWDGSTYWNGVCNIINCTDYKKVRDKYAYQGEMVGSESIWPPVVRYGDEYRNGESRVRTLNEVQAASDEWDAGEWADTSDTCNSAGTLNAYDCDGTYSVTYHRQKRTLTHKWIVVQVLQSAPIAFTYDDYRAGSQASREQVDGQCNYHEPVAMIMQVTLSISGITLSLSEAIDEDLNVALNYEGGGNINATIPAGDTSVMLTGHFIGGNEITIDSFSPERTDLYNIDIGTGRTTLLRDYDN